MKHIFSRIICGLLLIGMMLPLIVACGDTKTPSADGGGGGGGDVLTPQSSSIVINEICPDNTGSLPFSGTYYDWIELYNMSNEPVDISGWTITDNYEKDPYALTFPEGTVINGYGFLVILAVGAEDAAKWNSSRIAAPFRLSQYGEELTLSDKRGVVRDHIAFPAISSKPNETSYARAYDGDTDWGEADPTPGSSNDGKARVLSTSLMEFSHESGFYKDPFSLSISVPEGYKVYYTTNCNDPLQDPSAEMLSEDETIEIYDKSAEADSFSDILVTGTGNYMYIPKDPVDKCFVLRACVVNLSNLRSRTVTKTFFIGYDEKDGYTDIPILTLTSDPYDLYDEENGLFVSDRWTSDTNRQEIEADMTFLDENRNFVFEQKVGIRIRGTSTRDKHQKNLNVYARSRYDGNTTFKDPLFSDVARTHSFTLRQDGMDRLVAGQGFLQDLVSDRAISTQDYFPTVVFLDGEYYGIYNLYERFSEDYVEEHYGVDKDNTWIVKKGGAASSMEANCTDAANDYTNLMHFICNYGQTNDLSDPDTYELLTERVDMQSLCDILAVQLYIGNEDFSMAQNITAWRSSVIDPANPYADGKWRFVIYDLDFTLECTANDFTYTSSYNPFTQPQPWAGGGFLNWAYNWDRNYPFSLNLLKSADFVEQFSATFEEIATVNFAFDRVNAEMNRCITRLLPNMEKYVARYHSWYRDGAETLEEDFYANMLPDRTYLETRAQYVIPYMRAACGLN